MIKYQQIHIAGSSRSLLYRAYKYVQLYKTHSECRVEFIVHGPVSQETSQPPVRERSGRLGGRLLHPLGRGRKSPPRRAGSKVGSAGGHRKRVPAGKEPA